MGMNSLLEVFGTPGTIRITSLNPEGGSISNGELRDPDMRADLVRRRAASELSLHLAEVIHMPDGAHPADALLAMSADFLFSIDANGRHAVPDLTEFATEFDEYEFQLEGPVCGLFHVGMTVGGEEEFHNPDRQVLLLEGALYGPGFEDGIDLDLIYRRPALRSAWKEVETKTTIYPHLSRLAPVLALSLREYRTDGYDAATAAQMRSDVYASTLRSLGFALEFKGSEGIERPTDWMRDNGFRLTDRQITVLNRGGVREALLELFAVIPTTQKDMRNTYLDSWGSDEFTGHEAIRISRTRKLVKERVRTLFGALAPAA